MTAIPEPRATVHQRIRQAWQRQVVPAARNRDRTALLAALVVADASLDAALRIEGYAGATAGERIHAASRSFSDYVGLRAARHIRHQAVHELDYRLCWLAAAAALAAYAKALWEHGVYLIGAWYPADDSIDGGSALVLLSSHIDVWEKGTACERSESGIPPYHLAAAGAA